MGRCTDAYTTINDTWQVSQKTGYFLGNVYAEIGEILGMGYCVDDEQTMQTVASQLMTSWGSHTKRLHKSITQMNCTRHDDITSKNGNVKQCFQMLQSNSDAYGGPGTG